MPYFITNACVDTKDTACVSVCPVDCPVEAIYAEDDLPEDQLKYIEVNTKYFELKDEPDSWTEWKEQNSELFQKVEN